MSSQITITWKGKKYTSTDDFFSACIEAEVEVDGYSQGSSGGDNLNDKDSNNDDSNNNGWYGSGDEEEGSNFGNDEEENSNSGDVEDIWDWDLSDLLDEI